MLPLGELCTASVVVNVFLWPWCWRVHEAAKPQAGTTKAYGPHTLVLSCCFIAGFYIADLRWDTAWHWLWSLIENSGKSFYASVIKTPLSAFLVFFFRWYTLDSEFSNTESINSITARLYKQVRKLLELLRVRSQICWGKMSYSMLVYNVHC